MPRKPDPIVVALALPPIKVPRMPVYIVAAKTQAVATREAAKLRRMLREANPANP